MDSAGYVYACSADGNNSDATQERIESLMKFKHSAAGMQLVDYFTPAQWKQFDINDLDFRSTGVVLVPNQNMTVSGDKSGNLYFANTQHLGGLTATDASLYQKVSMGNGTGFFGSPVYYDGLKDLASMLGRTTTCSRRGMCRPRTCPRHPSTKVHPVA